MPAFPLPERFAKTANRDFGARQHCVGMKLSILARLRLPLAWRSFLRWLPIVSLDCALIGYKRRVRVILKMRCALQNTGFAPEFFNLLEVRLAQREVCVFHTIGRFAQHK